jgi:dTDP-4-dehydrorhamnose 3,5-epimerase-like enzyme
MLLKLVELNLHKDTRGNLVVAEQNKNVPFNINRVFFIYNVEEGERRGAHAHKQTRQMIVCVNGSVKILVDNGSERETFLLDSPSTGLLIEPSDWHEMYDFSLNTMLVVLASMTYDPNDYLRDYIEFLKYWKS